MTQEERDFIAEQFKSVHQKLDLTINPVKEDVTDIKAKVEYHSGEIIELKEFKKGHQEHHRERTESRRFNWEIIASSGILGGIMIWLYQLGGKP